jgi:hypothetical protein
MEARIDRDTYGQQLGRPHVQIAHTWFRDEGGSYCRNLAEDIRQGSLG